MDDLEVGYFTFFGALAMILGAAKTLNIFRSGPPEALLMLLGVLSLVIAINLIIN